MLRYDVVCMYIYIYLYYSTCAFTDIRYMLQFSVIHQHTYADAFGIAGNWGAFNFGSWQGKCRLFKVSCFFFGLCSLGSVMRRPPAGQSCMHLLVWEEEGMHSVAPKDIPSSVLACSTWMWQLGTSRLLQRHLSQCAPVCQGVFELLFRPRIWRLLLV